MPCEILIRATTVVDPDSEVSSAARLVRKSFEGAVVTAQAVGRD